MSPHAAAQILRPDSADITRRDHRIETVSVSGRRTVAESTVATTRTAVDSTQLAQSFNVSFAELLTHHSPVFVQTYGPGALASVKFRGTMASHTQVEWNGIRINNPMIGQVDFSLLPVWFVDRVTLYHGGSSLGIGSGGLGGAVVTGSAARWDRKFYGIALQSAGSFDTYQTFVMAGGGNRTVQGRVRYLYETAQNDFEYLRYPYLGEPERVRQQHADYRKQGAEADLWVNAGRGNLFSLNFWYLNTDRNLPNHTYYFGPGREEEQHDEELRAVVNWTKYGARYKSEFLTGFAATGLDYRKADRSGTTGDWFVDADSHSAFRSLYNKYRFEYRFSERTTLEANLNGDGQFVRIRHRASYDSDDGGEHSRGEFGASATLRHRFSDAFSGFVLVREELIAKKFTPVMPGLGLEYRPLHTDALRIVVNGARNYHQPTLGDLYWDPGGNPDLLPEEGLTGDLSAIYALRKGAWSLDATLTGYLSKGTNWIVWQPKGSLYQYQAENVADVFSRGAEAALHGGWDAPRWRLHLYGNYAYTLATDRTPGAATNTNPHAQIPHIPVHKGNMMLDGGWRGWYALWCWTAVSTRYKSGSAGSGRHTLAGYDLHDATLGWRHEIFRFGFDIQGVVRNVFSTRYEPMSGRAAPGRNFQLVLKITF